MVPDKCLIGNLGFKYPIKARRQPYSQFQHERLLMDPYFFSEIRGNPEC